MSSHTRLARSIQRKADAAAQRYPNGHYGTVIDTDPLKIELHDRDLVLVEDYDLLLSQWVKLYSDRYGIEQDDGAWVGISHGQYTVLDIISDTDMPDTGGGGDLTYVYTQVSANTMWNVAHNLGKFPSVSVVDSGGTELLADVHYIDINSVQLLFGAATSGKAYMN